MSAMADFARMPTRQKATVFIVIGLLLGALYWQFVFKGLKADVAAAEAEHAAKKGLNKKLEADIPAFQKLKERMVTLKRIIDENQKALPTEAELPAFFETLNRKVLESGVEVIRSKQGKEEPIETFLKVPIDYEIQGTFVQIKKFFASLVPKKKRSGQQEAPVPGGEQEIEERERIVSIENLSLTTPVVRNREIRLTAKFTASTYRQEEKKEAPAGKPEAKGAAPDPSPAAAGTPKGAREQTEKALDKGDDRNRDATKVDEAKTPSGSGAQRMKGGL
jgi:type IV pilus assembly protein PilO